MKISLSHEMVGDMSDCFVGRDDFEHACVHRLHDGRYFVLVQNALLYYPTNQTRSGTVLKL